MSYTHNPCSGFPLHMRRVALRQASVILTGTLAMALTFAVSAPAARWRVLPIHLRPRLPGAARRS